MDQKQRPVIKTFSCTQHLSLVNRFTLFLLYMFGNCSPFYAHTSIGKAYSKGNGNFKLVLLFPHSLLQFPLTLVRVCPITHTYFEAFEYKKMGNSLKMEVLGDEPAMPDCFSPFSQVSLFFSS